jgi:hypothetical protein
VGAADQTELFLEARHSRPMEDDLPLIATSLAWI